MSIPFKDQIFRRFQIKDILVTVEEIEVRKVYQINFVEGNLKMFQKVAQDFMTWVNIDPITYQIILV